MINKKMISLSICITLLSVMFLGCIGQQADTPKVEVPQILDVGVMCFAHADAVVDPAKGWSSWFTRRAGIYETLTKLDRDMALQPWLATDWKQVDENTWKFNIRQGVTFHDGTPLTAESVAFSLDSLLREGGFRFNPRARPLLSIREIRVVDEHTLRITTYGPFAPLLYHLSDPLFAIVSPDTKEGEIPAGTGPFKFVEQKVGEFVRVERFNDYWNGPARLEKVIFHYMPDATVRGMALEAGNIDVAVRVTSVDALRLDRKEDIRVSRVVNHRTDFMRINCDREPLSDPRVRRAINYAIDREGIVNAASEGIYKPAATLYPPILPWSNRDLEVVYDMDKARTLLKEAGLVDTDGDGVVEFNGEPLIVRLYVAAGRADLILVAEIVQANLEKIGIRVNIVAMEFGAMRAMERAGNFDLSFTSWGTAPAGDPAYILEINVRSGGEHNYGRFSHKGLDELLTRGQTTFDRQERVAIYNEVQKVLRDESPLVFLFHRAEKTGMHTAVQGLEGHPAEMYLLHKDIYLNARGRE